MPPNTNDTPDDWGDALIPVDTDRELFPPIDFRGPAYLSDRFFYRVVVCGLVVAVLSALIGSIWLAACEKEIPEAIVAMGSAAIGALASVLTVNRH